MNAGSRKIKILMSVTGAALLAAVILMGVFQISAAIRAGTFTGESLKRNLTVSLYHTGQELFANEFQLISLLYPLRQDLNESNIRMSTDVFDSWYESMSDASHIKGVYFKAGISGTRAFRYFPDDFAPVEVVSIPKGLFMIPFRFPGKEREFFIDIDKDILYGTMLPDVLGQIGSEYSWRIMDSYGKLVFEQGMEGIDYSHELKINLGDHFLFSFNELRGFQAFSGKARNSDNKPGDVVVPDLKEDWGTLEIYFSQGPLNRIVSRQIALNIGASLVAIILIIGGYLILFRLYRRSEEQRQVEQEFVATISHELRTPLAVLSSAGENISRGIVKGERLVDYGGMITRESKRLEEMIEGVLYYSGLQKGSGRVLVQEEVDLEQLLDEIRQRYQMKSQDMDVRMEFDLPGDLPRVKTGRQAFLIIAGNLIHNGLLHAYPPGFPVEQEKRIVFVRLKLSGNMVVLEVEDKGCGIPSKEQKKVFKAFTRGEMSRRSQIPGSGLGLNIASRVAELCGGMVELTTRPFPGSAGSGFSGGNGSGTLFRLILPVDIIKGTNNE